VLRTAWLKACLLSACLALGAAGPVDAQSPAPPTPADRAAYDAAFKAMIADPGNLQKSFAFAELAIKVGDLEGAVAALERMLIIAPNLPRVRLELGVLYYRLGSYETSRRYISEVLNAPDVPPEVRQRAEVFLAQIDRRISPHGFSGTMMYGFRYQSNANASPGGTIQAGGVPTQLDQRFSKKADGNAFVLGSFQHLWDLGWQGGEVLDTQATIYGAKQFKVNDVNLVYGSISTGPRLNLMPETMPGWTVRPFVGFEYVFIGNATEYVSPGGGVWLEKRFADGLVGFGPLLRYRDYHNSGDSPTNDFRSGTDFSGQVYAEWKPATWVLLSGMAGAGHFWAKKSWETYQEFILGASAQFTVDRPSWAPGEELLLVFLAARVWDNYRSPDPSVDPNVKRRDREWRLSVTAQVPIQERLALVLQGARNSRTSSLPNYEYTDYIAMAGFSWRF
jgi:hypothetical protein